MRMRASERVSKRETAGASIIIPVEMGPEFILAADRRLKEHVLEEYVVAKLFQCKIDVASVHAIPIPPRCRVAHPRLRACATHRCETRLMSCTAARPASAHRHRPDAAGMPNTASRRTTRYAKSRRRKRKRCHDYRLSQHREEGEGSHFLHDKYSRDVSRCERVLSGKWEAWVRCSLSGSFPAWQHAACW